VKGKQLLLLLRHTKCTAYDTRIVKSGIYPASTQGCRSLHWREYKDRQIWVEIGIYHVELEVTITSGKIDNRQIDYE
jgi:hypothetical protein